MKPHFSIRSILPNDDKSIALIIRNALTEFGANKPGTVFFDAATDHLSEVFKKENSIYFIAEMDGEIVGGAGIYPSDGLPNGVCELVKMYLSPNARGLGLGRILIEKCIAFAQEKNYQQIYIETMPELKNALSMYEKFGWEYIDKPMGNTGHFGCSLWMVKTIEN
ncbi:MAG: GNAT family N-acetyltransferase [Bacteroidetes bacterium]|nr:GNAT family N-acetyltransferase [Bacteroidota bacterium]